jgi:hypothetical protein
MLVWLWAHGFPDSWAIKVWNVVGLAARAVEIEKDDDDVWQIADIEVLPGPPRETDEARTARIEGVEMAVHEILDPFLELLNGDFDNDELANAALRVFRRWDDLWRGSGCVTSAWLLASCNVRFAHADVLSDGQPGGRTNWLYSGAGVSYFGGHLSPLVEWACQRGYLAFDPASEGLLSPTSAGHARSCLGSLCVALGLLIDRQASNRLLGPSAVWSGVRPAGEAAAVADNERAELVAVSSALISQHNQMLRGSGFWAQLRSFQDFGRFPMVLGINVSANRFPVWFWPYIWGSKPYCEQRAPPGTDGQRRVVPQVLGDYPRNPVVDLAGYTRPGACLYVCLGEEDGWQQPAIWIHSPGAGTYDRPTWRPWDLGFEDHPDVLRVRSVYTVPLLHLYGDRKLVPLVEVTRVTAPLMLATLGALMEPRDAPSSDSLQQVVVTDVISEALGLFRL